MKAEQETPKQLSPGDIELLVCLCEEAGEVAQAVCKLLRHGAYGFHPDTPDGPTNLESLEREIGELQRIIDILLNLGLLSWGGIERAKNLKAVRLSRYLHGRLMAGEK